MCRHGLHGSKHEPRKSYITISTQSDYAHAHERYVLQPGQALVMDFGVRVVDTAGAEIRSTDLACKLSFSTGARVSD